MLKPWQNKFKCTRLIREVVTHHSFKVALILPLTFTRWSWKFSSGLWWSFRWCILMPVTFILMTSSPWRVVLPLMRWVFWIGQQLNFVVVITLNQIIYFPPEGSLTFRRKVTIPVKMVIGIAGIDGHDPLIHLCHSIIKYIVEFRAHQHDLAGFWKWVEISNSSQHSDIYDYWIDSC